MATQQEYNVLLQKQRSIYLKIEILDFNENTVFNLEGISTDGGVTVDADSTIRRNCNLTLELKNNTYLPSETSPIWLNKKFIPYVGVKNNLTDEIVWYKQGVFFLSNPKIESSKGKIELSLTGLDKMCWLNGQLSGMLQYKTKLLAETPLYNAIKNTVALSGEARIMISDVDGLTLPYDFDKSETETITSVLDQIKGLYMDFEYFYDINGNFIYQKIKDRKNDPVVYDLSDNKLIINHINNPDWDNIKNDYIVWGRLMDDGTQAKITGQLTGQFSTTNIGKKTYAVSDDNIFTTDQAQSRLNYEEFIHGNLNESVNFSTVPIYDLQPNIVIQLNDNNSGVNGRYRVKKFNIPFKNDLSTVDGQKMYYDS